MKRHIGSQIQMAQERCLSINSWFKYKFILYSCWKTEILKQNIMLHAQILQKRNNNKKTTGYDTVLIKALIKTFPCLYLIKYDAVNCLKNNLKI